MGAFPDSISEDSRPASFFPSATTSAFPISIAAMENPFDSSAGYGIGTGGMDVDESVARYMNSDIGTEAIQAQAAAYVTLGLPPPEGMAEFLGSNPETDDPLAAAAANETAIAKIGAINPDMAKALAAKYSTGEEPDKGLLGNITDAVGNVLQPALSIGAKALDLVGRPMHSVLELLDTTDKGDSFYEDIAQGLSGKSRTDGAKLVRNWFGEDTPGWVQGVAGFGVEFAADPLTWLTFGLGAVAKNSAMAAGKVALTKGSLIERGFGTVDDLDGLAKAVAEEIGSFTGKNADAVDMAVAERFTNMPADLAGKLGGVYGDVDAGVRAFNRGGLRSLGKEEYAKWAPYLEKERKALQAGTFAQKKTARQVAAFAGGMRFRVAMPFIGLRYTSGALPGTAGRKLFAPMSNFARGYTGTGKLQQMARSAGVDPEAVMGVFELPGIDGGWAGVARAFPDKFARMGATRPRPLLQGSVLAGRVTRHFVGRNAELFRGGGVAQMYARDARTVAQATEKRIMEAGWEYRSPDGKTMLRGTQLTKHLEKNLSLDDADKAKLYAQYMDGVPPEVKTAEELRGWHEMKRQEIEAKIARGGDNVEDYQAELTELDERVGILSPLYDNLTPEETKALDIIQNVQVKLHGMMADEGIRIGNRVLDLDASMSLNSAQMKTWQRGTHSSLKDQTFYGKAGVDGIPGEEELSHGAFGRGLEVEATPGEGLVPINIRSNKTLFVGEGTPGAEVLKQIDEEIAEGIDTHIAGMVEDGQLSASQIEDVRAVAVARGRTKMLQARGYEAVMEKTDDGWRGMVVGPADSDSHGWNIKMLDDDANDRAPDAGFFSRVLTPEAAEKLGYKLSDYPEGVHIGDLKPGERRALEGTFDEANAWMKEHYDIDKAFDDDVVRVHATYTQRLSKEGSRHYSEAGARKMMDLPMPGKSLLGGELTWKAGTVSYSALSKQARHMNKLQKDVEVRTQKRQMKVEDDALKVAADLEKRAEALLREAPDRTQLGVAARQAAGAEADAGADVGDRIRAALVRRAALAKRAAAEDAAEVKLTKPGKSEVVPTETQRLKDEAVTARQKMNDFEKANPGANHPDHPLERAAQEANNTYQEALLVEKLAGMSRKDFMDRYGTLDDSLEINGELQRPTVESLMEGVSDADKSRLRNGLDSFDVVDGQDGTKKLVHSGPDGKPDAVVEVHFSDSGVTTGEYWNDPGELRKRLKKIDDERVLREQEMANTTELDMPVSTKTVRQLDAENAPDSAYRLSDERSLGKGETYRQRRLNNYKDMKRIGAHREEFQYQSILGNPKEIPEGASTWREAVEKRIKRIESERTGRVTGVHIAADKSAQGKGLADKMMDLAEKKFGIMGIGELPPMTRAGAALAKRWLNKKAGLSKLKATFAAPPVPGATAATKAGARRANKLGDELAEVEAEIAGLMGKRKTLKAGQSVGSSGKQRAAAQKLSDADRVTVAKSMKRHAARQRQLAVRQQKIKDLGKELDRIRFRYTRDTANPVPAWVPGGKTKPVTQGGHQFQYEHMTDIAGMEDIYMHPYIAAEFKHVLGNKTLSETRKNWRRFASLPWKRWSTVYYPGFHVRNFMGAWFNNWLGGVGTRHYFDYMRLHKALSGDLGMGQGGRAGEGFVRRYFGAGAFGKADGEVMWGDVAAMYREQNIHSSHAGVMGEVLPAAELEARRAIGASTGKTKLDAIKDNPYARVMRKTTNVTENLFRGAAWLQGMESTGGSTIGARGFVMMRHGDYEEFSDAEDFVRDLVPFYKWMRTNIPMQLHQVLENPARPLAAMKASHAAFVATGQDDNEWRHKLPPYAQKGFLLPNLLADKKNGPGYFALDMPMSDLYTGAEDMFNAFLPMLRPVLEAKLWKGRMAPGGGGEIIPLKGRAPLAPWLDNPVMGKVLDFLPGLEKDVEGRSTISGETQQILTALPIFAKFKDWVYADPDSVERRGKSLWSTVAGMRPEELGIDELTMYEKSFLAEQLQPTVDMFRQLGAPLPDKDTLSPELYEELGLTVPEVESAFEMPAFGGE